MNSYRKILILVALLFSVVLSITVYLSLNQRVETLNKVENALKETLVIAAVDIELGTKIEAQMLEVIEIDSKNKPQQAFSQLDQLVGQYARTTLYSGEMILEQKVSKDQRDDLALRVPEGFRALSLSVSQYSGVSDLVKVGDWVDLVIWLPEIKEAQRIIRPDIAKVALQHIQVLSVNRDLQRQVQYAQETIEAYTLTLSIPLQEVERFVLAESVGSVIVSLRPLDSTLIFQTPGVIWQDLLIDDFGRIKDLFPQYDIQGGQETQNAPVEIEKYTHYTVQYGDTLQKIAFKFYGDANMYTWILDVNQIQDENIIFPGMSIKIPQIAKTDN